MVIGTHCPVEGMAGRSKLLTGVAPAVSEHRLILNCPAVKAALFLIQKESC